MTKNFNYEISAELSQKHNEKRVSENYFLGSIWGVWDKEGKVYGSLTGFSDLKRTKPITENSIFRLASMTKPITGTAILQQVEKGKIDIDLPITKWFPEFENMKVAKEVKDGKIISVVPANKQITPRMLLSHSSGLGSGDTYYAQLKDFKRNKSLRESVKIYSESVLEFQPGYTETYSPFWAFDVLACLIETVTDMPYDEYLKKHIFQPLGMKDTTYHPTDEQIAREVDFVTRVENGFTPYDISPKVGMEGLKDGWVGGGAGLFSTINDYSNFARMLLNDGELDGVKILKKESVDLMAYPQELEDIYRLPPHFRWGLSVRVCPAKHPEIQPLPIGSFGWSGSYGTHFWVDRKSGMTCIYLMNLSNARGAGEPAKDEFEWDVVAGITD